MDAVVSVFPNGRKELHTTRSWDFVGFSQQVTRTSAESDLIIGMLDTGIWPESQSFNDEYIFAPPSKWKGSCQASANFTCNNKIIGAKYYRVNGQFPEGDIQSPRDTEGHGSHTPSTAAGRSVSKASLYGLGSGTARGGVPSARIAVYKICWSDSCYDADILAAFDDAITDGVDIISLSVGGTSPYQYFEDSIAIGAFHAMKNGILTSNSAGNSGPGPQTVTNVSPWSLSVAASTIDRRFVTDVQLGNGEVYEGVSINTFDLEDQYPLVYGGDVPNTQAGYNGSQSRYCEENSLDKHKVRGKIVLCDWTYNGTIIAGALGTIMQDDGFKDAAFSFPISSTYLSTNDGNKVYNYLYNTREPTARIIKSTEKTSESSPFVVSFSSRGPNAITSDILKPDLSAPGVDILAAWSEGTTVTGSKQGDKRVVPYNIISGTSMACPHATAAALYVKSFNPTMSPAAIKSALSTTATPMSSSANSEAEFAYGSGQINPIKAAHPGLVYDMGENDYVKFLCGQGYSTKNLRIITGDKTCCTSQTNATVWDLNYPSFTISSSKKTKITRVFHRTVTNVGTPVSTYRAAIVAPEGLSIRVEPSLIKFKLMGQKQSFVVSVTAEISETMISGSLVWDDGVHLVRSPIVAYASIAKI
ncbi:hypothetical protein RND71_036708 [Anisodus tanguticus]|uniref:Cucumisin n=1 Tax=Anisodus tanguticus TaxID=243964 RepID=A0AAE1V039_9SOLA|nr:hypothetical protein RND71_036708 [Anisodus tanguticus]